MDIISTATHTGPSQPAMLDHPHFSAKLARPASATKSSRPSTNHQIVERTNCSTRCHCQGQQYCTVLPLNRMRVLSRAHRKRPAAGILGALRVDWSVRTSPWSSRTSAYKVRVVIRVLIKKEWLHNIHCYLLAGKAQSHDDESKNKVSLAALQEIPEKAHQEVCAMGQKASICRNITACTSSCQICLCRARSEYFFWYAAPQIIIKFITYANNVFFKFSSCAESNPGNAHQSRKLMSEGPVWERCDFEQRTSPYAFLPLYIFCIFLLFVGESTEMAIKYN